MNYLWVLSASVVVGLIVLVKFLIWYFDSTVCIACYKKVRVRKSYHAPGFRKEKFRLCKNCMDNYYTAP